jgi:hypothetical protein
MFDDKRPLHRQIEDVDPGWLKGELTAMARSALIAVGLSLTVGLALGEYLHQTRKEGAVRIVVAPEQPARGAGGATSCPGASSRCGKPAFSR